MAKLCVPQSACAGIDVNGRRYRADRSGRVDVPDHLVRTLKRNGELFEPNLAGPRSEGFICQSCGFHAVFRTCGRCGGPCTRPNEGATDGASTHNQH